MTENEAIKEIQRLCCNEPQYYPKGERKCKDNCMYGDNFCSFQMAIKALEEVQEYRKLGTVEECREAVGKTRVRTMLESEHKGIQFFQCPECDEQLCKTDRYCHECGCRVESEE